MFLRFLITLHPHGTRNPGLSRLHLVRASRAAFPDLIHIWTAKPVAIYLVLSLHRLWLISLKMLYVRAMERNYIFSWTNNSFCLIYITWYIKLKWILINLNEYHVDLLKMHMEVNREHLISSLTKWKEYPIL